MTAATHPTFEPAFTQAEVFALEAAYNETWGQSRRLMMLVLSCSSEQLIINLTCPDSDNEARILSLAGQINDYGEHLKAGVELADAAVARLLIIGQIIIDG